MGGYLIKGTPPNIEAVSVFTQPFRSASRWGVASDGERVVIAEQTSGSVNAPAEVSVRAFSLEGEELFTTSYGYEPIPIPASLVDSLLAPYGVGAFALADVREAAYIPDAFPPVSDILFGPGRLVWIGDEKAPDVARDWRVMSERGQAMALLRAPPGYAIQLIGESDVWGITTDEFDVPYLVKRPIVRE